MVEYQGESIDLGSPFRRASMADLVKEVRSCCPTWLSHSAYAASRLHEPGSKRTEGLLQPILRKRRSSSKSHLPR